MALVYAASGRNSPGSDAIKVITNLLIQMMGKRFRNMHLDEIKIAFLKGVKDTDWSANGAISAALLYQWLETYHFTQNEAKYEARKALEPKPEPPRPSTVEDSLNLIQTTYDQYPTILAPVPVGEDLKRFGLIEKDKLRMQFEKAVYALRDSQALTQSEKMIKRLANEYKPNTEFKDINSALVSTCLPEAYKAYILHIFSGWKTQDVKNIREVLQVK